MLRFSIGEHDSLAASATNAYLVSRDDQVVHGTIKVEDGHIEAAASGHSNIGLCLLHEAGTAGTLMLRTALLPPRGRPYQLSLELARYRIKLFLDKSEEWSMFDLSSEHPAVEQWEAARQVFTRALVTPNPIEADTLAHEALEQAIASTERLALAHAQILLHRRYGNRSASNSTLGVRTDGSRYDTGLRDLVQHDFDLAVIPMRWTQIEPSQGTFEWSEADRWVAWASEQQKPVILGPLLDFSRADGVPAWVKEAEHDYAALREVCYDHVERVVQRYAGVVNFWSLGAGINLNRHLRLSGADMVDLVRMAALRIRETRRDARVLLEFCEPFGEYVSSNADALGPFVFLERIFQEGIRLDALGVRLLIGAGSGMAARDLMQLSSLLDRFFLTEIPLVVSALGSPCATLDDQAGIWHEPWNEEQQAQWASQMMGIALSKPFVDSVIWAELFDHEAADLAMAGLVTGAGKPRPALARLVNMRRRLKTPLGPLKLPKRTADSA